MTNTKTFTGSAQSFHGPVTAVVTITDGKITNVESENVAPNTPGELAIDRMKDQMAEQQTADVDAVTGASISTTNFKKAVRKALAVYRGEMTKKAALD
uniref:FMN-binding protein n=1 Tax=Companilactobacillus sp. TaxID=2767905 RepID=UPI00261A0320